MSKNLLAVILFALISNHVSSQCAIQNWSLEKRTSLSKEVIEGKVIDQYPFRALGKNAIYTASVIEVYKVFKGNPASPYYIEIITFGGQIGMEKHRADPELELQKGDMGVFLLTENLVELPSFVKNNGKSKFQGTASEQSFIRYDLDENVAHDGLGNFYGIETEFYETLQNLTKIKYLNIKSSGYNPDRLKYRPTASPVISSFSPANANSGTGDIITIVGQGFGSKRGKGRIEFLDANFGDGRRFKTPYSADYSVWTDTLIKVRIPSRAGSGSIKVATNDSGTFTTFTSFKVNFAHMNASYQPTGNAEQYYPLDHLNDNAKGGYTFQLNPRFKANSGMVNSFLTSLETWRCGTLMNWDVGRDTGIKVTNGDKVNIVRLTKFADSKLAVCYSYFNGCFLGTGTNMEWFVVELDIEVDSTIKWYYGTGNPASTEYDFQSVMSHELGHGHCLGHVIASAEMMHWSISNGQRKSTLSTNDLAGGNYVMDKSVKINVCSGSRLVALNSNNCGYTKPLAGFRANLVTACTNASVTFTDTSKGIVKNYFWRFGADANTPTLSGKGPHNILYSTEGNKTIKLIVSNDFGIDSIIKTNYVTVLPSKPPVPLNLKYSDTACLALTTLSVDSMDASVSFQWNMPPQAAEISNTHYTKKISWTAAGGPYLFNVKSVNICGKSDSVVGKVKVLGNPTSVFTAFENNRVVTFSNTSQNASTYKWYFGDGDSSGAKNPVHTYPMGKAYSVILKSINRCKTVTSTKTANPTHAASIEKFDFLNTMVYPNPVMDVLTLSKDIESFTLTNLTGQVQEQDNNHIIDFSDRPVGVYTLNIYMYNGANYFLKIIKN